MSPLRASILLVVHVVVLVPVGCQTLEVDLRGRPCGDAGACPGDLVCHPEAQRCAPRLAACGQGGPCLDELDGDATCRPEEEGAFIGCADDPTSCAGGCRTCVGGIWLPCSGCSASNGGTETCDGLDNDCDGAADERDSAGCSPFYLDADGDGFGIADVRCYCGPTGLYRAESAGDCDDEPTGATSCGDLCAPGLAELCDGFDNDCDTTLDESSCASGSRCTASGCVACTDGDPLGCGSACAVCGGETPLCLFGQCGCAADSCAAGNFCDNGQCTSCGDNDPQHCGPSCLVCSATLPTCGGGECRCIPGSCLNGQGCLPSGVCAPGSTISTLTVTPRRLDADGVSEATLTITLLGPGSTPLVGHAVTLTSNRPGDIFEQPTATDGSGVTTGTVRSASAGLSTIYAVDTTASLPVLATVEIAFIATAGLAAHYRCDAPDATPLSNVDLGGPVSSGLRALWRFEENGGGSLLDAGGARAVPIGDPETFDGPIEGWEFDPQGQVDAVVDSTLPIDTSGTSGTARVIQAAAQAELQVSSITTGGTGFNWARLNYPHLDALAGDFDVQADFSIPAGAFTTLQGHFPARLVLYFGNTDTYAMAQYVTYNNTRYVEGASRNGTASAHVVGTPVANPLTSSALRIKRAGTTHEMFYWSGSAWTLLHSVTGSTATPLFLLLVNYAQRLEPIGLTTRFNNFVVTSAPTRTSAGKLGRALVFDGGDRVMRSAAGLSLGGAVTMAAWMSSEGGSSNTPPFLELSATGTSESHGLGIDNGGSVRGWLDCQGSSTRFTSLGPTSDFSSGDWHHVALTFDGTDARLYVDGVERDSDLGLSCTDLDDGAVIALGGAAGDAAQRFNGSLDETVVLSTAWTGPEVVAAYRRGRLTDSSAALHGVSRGPTGGTLGAFGQALSFDGIDDGVSLPLGAIAALAGDFTVSLWVSTNAAANDTEASLFDAFGNSSTGVRLWLDGARDFRAVATVGDGGQSLELSAGESLNDGAWHHLAVRRIGSVACLWIDGASLECGDGPGGGVAGNAAWLGRRASLSKNVLVGSIDEVRVFSRGLSDDELRAEAGGR